MTIFFRVDWEGYDPIRNCPINNYTFAEAESPEEAISIVKKLPIEKDYITDYEAIEETIIGSYAARDFGAFTKYDVIPDISQELFEEIMKNMVNCPAGSFIMGRPNRGEHCHDPEIQHQVVLTKAFKIGKYPVTQKEYLLIMGINPSKFKGVNNPVDNVSYYDAKKFCEILNLRFKNNLPKGYKFYLPTEAQWEYACRAGTTTDFYNGNDLNVDFFFPFLNRINLSKIDEVCWCRPNSNNTTHSVGQKKPNALGIYDMCGNVWEWCYDREGDYPH